MRVQLVMTTDVVGGVSRHVGELAQGLPALGCDVVAAGEDADIVHIHLHDTYDRRAYALAVLARARGAQLILTEHLPRTNASDPSLLPGPRRRGAAIAKRTFKRTQARIARRIITVCESSKEFLNDRYGISGSRVRTIVNGVVLPAAYAAPAPEGPLRIVATGALCAQKGHEVLVEAAVRAREEWTATIIGEGPARPALQRRIDALKDGRVSLAGWRDDAINASLTADVFCLPSRWETFPYVVLDAMARARCAVVSNVDGLPDMVEHGVTGMLVEPDDPDALARALDHLATHPDDVHRMGLAARASAAGNFTVDRMIRATNDLYEEALNG